MGVGLETLRPRVQFPVCLNAKTITSSFPLEASSMCGSIYVIMIMKPRSFSPARLLHQMHSRTIRERFRMTLGDLYGARLSVSLVDNKRDTPTCS